LVMKEAKRRFNELPPAAQKKYSQTATGIRKLATNRITPLARAATMQHEEDLGQGPLGIASLGGPFPVVPAALERHHQTRTFAQCVQHYKDPKQHPFYTDPLPDFPATVTEERVCR